MSDTSNATEPKHRVIAVIDGNSLMHRAFHAIRQPMSAPDGRATNALFGFFNMFIKLVESFKPDGVICAFDKGKPQVRIDMLPQYKAQRPPMDPALHEQFPMVKDLLRSLDVPVVECPGWEGDDILGTLARQGEEAGYDMYLFTGDRDMYQLATDHVRIVSTKKGVSEVQIMTPESVDDLYHGITPELVPDFYGLKGDSSDNIPGVPGIGPKKASALIVKYGNLDEVIAHADEVKGKMGENLRAHVDDALLSRKIATIRKDAPIDVKLEDAKFPTFDPVEVTKAFSELGFTGMTRRLVRLEGSDAIAAADEAAPETSAIELPAPKVGDDALATLAAELGKDLRIMCKSAAQKNNPLEPALNDKRHGYRDLVFICADVPQNRCIILLLDILLHNSDHAEEERVGNALDKKRDIIHLASFQIPCRVIRDKACLPNDLHDSGFCLRIDIRVIVQGSRYS